MANGGSNPYQLNDQDVTDLQQIQSQLQPSDPRYGKITALLATRPPSPGQMANQALAASGIPGGAAPPAGMGINPVQDMQGPVGRFATAFGAQLGPRPMIGEPMIGRDASGQVRNITFTPPPSATAPVSPPGSSELAPAPQRIYQRITGGDVAGGLGEAAGSLFRFGAPLVAGRATNTPETMTLRPGAMGPSTTYTPPQVKAQAITQAINPPPGEYPSLGRNLVSQTGNIIDFAQRTGNPLNTNTDFARAAQGAGYETQQYLKNNFVDPVANDEVSIAGSGYQGRTVGEGQRATIGDINARIGQINDLLRDNYIKRRAGQEMQSVAQDADLKAEHDSLVNILHDAISTRLGIDPADIAALRQRSGQLYSIADQTQAAVNDRLASYQKQQYGQTLPESSTQLVLRVLNQLRGGPEANASRALRGALGSSNFQATPLPSPQGPAASASPPWLNYLPEEDPYLARARALQEAAAQQRRGRGQQP